MNNNIFLRATGARRKAYTIVKATAACRRLALSFTEKAHEWLEEVEYRKYCKTGVMPFSWSEMTWRLAGLLFMLDFHIWFQRARLFSRHRQILKEWNLAFQVFVDEPGGVVQFNRPDIQLGLEIREPEDLDILLSRFATVVECVKQDRVLLTDEDFMNDVEDSSTEWRG